jgi:hypothetical protein
MTQVSGAMCSALSEIIEKRTYVRFCIAGVAVRSRLGPLGQFRWGLMPGIEQALFRRLGALLIVRLQPHAAGAPGPAVLQMPASEPAAQDCMQ